MKKKKNRHRKLRKCERGIKTKSINKGCRYAMTNIGLIPETIITRSICGDDE